jgi:transposase
MLTAGNVSDIKAAPALLKRAGRMRYLLADNGYDADRLRRSLRDADADAVPVIPGRRNRKVAVRYHKNRYRGRHLIENAFCRLTDFRRVATRYDKLTANFLSGVALATAVAFWLPLNLNPSGMTLMMASKIIAAVIDPLSMPFVSHRRGPIRRSADMGSPCPRID